MCKGNTTTEEGSLEKFAGDLSLLYIFVHFIFYSSFFPAINFVIAIIKQIEQWTVYAFKLILLELMAAWKICNNKLQCYCLYPDVS
jgi:hypothetical protein